MREYISSISCSMKLWVNTKDKRYWQTITSGGMKGQRYLYDMKIHWKTNSTYSIKNTQWMNNQILSKRKQDHQRENRNKANFVLGLVCFSIFLHNHREETHVLQCLSNKNNYYTNVWRCCHIWSNQKYWNLEIVNHFVVTTITLLDMSSFKF